MSSIIHSQTGLLSKTAPLFRMTSKIPPSPQVGSKKQPSFTSTFLKHLISFFPNATQVYLYLFKPVKTQTHKPGLFNNYQALTMGRMWSLHLCFLRTKHASSWLSPMKFYISKASNDGPILFFLSLTEIATATFYISTFLLCQNWVDGVNTICQAMAKVLNIQTFTENLPAEVLLSSALLWT